MHPAAEYKPYKKKARWKRILDKQLIIVNNKIAMTARKAYLYLTARRKKQESFKKRRQKWSKGSQYWRVRKMRILFGAICARTAVVAAVRENITSQPREYMYDPCVVAYPTVCMAAPTRTQGNLREREQSVVFDAESFDLLIDNCASGSITNSLNDFTSPPVPSNTKIVGINGTTEASLVGTVRWDIEDDLGRVHQIILPGTYYSASARSRLLSPQHWAQQAEDNYPAPNGTWCATYAKKIKLYWDQQKYSRTVYLNPRSNVGVLRTAPNVEKYAKACERIEDRIGTVAMPTVIETEDFYEGEGKSEPNMITDSEEEGENTSIEEVDNTNGRKGRNRRSSTRNYAIKNVGFTFTRGGSRGRTSSTIYFQGTRIHALAC
jgi:hypothetical protein